MPVPKSVKVEGSGTAEGVNAVAENVLLPFPWVVNSRVPMVESKPATLDVMVPVPVKLPNMPFVTSVIELRLKVKVEALLLKFSDELPGTKLA